MAYKPIVWSVKSGILVRDLKKSEILDVMNFVIDEYLSKNILLHTMNVRHCYEDLIEYTKILKFIFRYDTSLIAVDDETQEIVGVLLGRPMIKEDYSWNFWKCITPENNHIDILMNLERDMITNNFPKREYRDPPTCYHVFVLCISSSRKGLGQKSRLLLDAYKVARSLGMPKLSFTALSSSDQARAEEIGMTEITRLCYGEYVSKEGEKIIPNYPTGEFYAIHYEMDLGPRCNMSLYEPRME